MVGCCWRRVLLVHRPPHNYCASSLRFLHLSGLPLLAPSSSSALLPLPSAPSPPLLHASNKHQILHHAGFTDLQIKSLLDGPHRRLFLSVPESKLSSLILLLKKHGVSGASAGRFLAQCPNVVRLRIDNVAAKIEFFGSRLGIHQDARLLLKLITHGSGNKSLISLSLQNIESHVNFLRDEIGLDYAGICRIVDRFPSFFALNVQRNLQVKLQLFQERGLDNKAIAWLWRTYPSILTLSDKGLSERFELLQHFGHDLKTRSGLCALGNWSSRSPKTLISRFESLQKKHGIALPDAVRMVQKYPRLICLTEESIAEKVDYLTKVLERDMCEILHYPEYLTYSLQKRIAPRFTVVHKLKSRGSLLKDPSLRLVLKMTDEIFAKRFPIDDQA